MFRKVACSVTLFALCACGAAPAGFDQAVRACSSGASHIEVEGSGTVQRVLGLRDSSSGVHEGFVLRAGSRNITVEDNVNITGPIPLRDGDAVTLRGQFECDDGVIHWTHRDPAMRHAGGYIRVGGRTYS